MVEFSVFEKSFGSEVNCEQPWSSTQLNRSAAVGRVPTSRASKNSPIPYLIIIIAEIIIIIIIAEMAVFNVAGYFIEDNIPNKFRILKGRHIQMRKPYQLPGWTKNSSYYSAPVGDRTHDLPPP